MSGFGLNFGSLQRRANPLYNIMAPPDIPFYEPPGQVNEDIKVATQEQQIRGAAGRTAYGVDRVPTKNGVPETKSRLFQAVETCEAVNTVDCSKFNDPTFAGTCLMSHELGKNSQGNSHIGGLVHFAEDKAAQLAYANQRGMVPAWKPTLGEAPEGKISTDYQSCVNLQEKLNCQRGKSYDLPNCAQCMNGAGNWTRVAPDTEKAEGELVLVGEGQISVTASDGSINKNETLSMNTPLSITIPANAEGTYIYVRVGTANARTAGPGTPSTKRIAGFLKGPTANSGTHKLDIIYIAENDSESGSRPRYIGVTTVDGTSVNILRPAVGRDSMNLSLYIPFTYIASNEEASVLCPGGPYQTKAASGTKLWTDPCAGSPGSYSLECLKQRFIGAGCINPNGGVGDMYPTTESKAQKLRYNGSTPRTAVEISEMVYNMSIEAKTGIRNGQKMSLTDWDRVSRDCYGVPIANPCAGDDQTNGPLSAECIQYLFNNRRGEGNPDTIGPTYTLDGLSESLNPQGYYCTKEGTASPYNLNVLPELQQTGKGVKQVQDYFDQIQQQALNNTLQDNERKEAVMKCYGINFASEPVIPSDPLNIIQGNDTRFSLESATAPNSFVRHASFLGYRHPFENTSLYKSDSSWIQRAPLNGRPGFISFESVNYPNYFIVNEGGRMALKPKTEDIIFIRRASWKVGSGSSGGFGCGLPGFESYENDLSPGTFLVTDPATNELRVKVLTTSDSEACWTRKTPANWPN